MRNLQDIKADGQRLLTDRCFWFLRAEPQLEGPKVSRVSFCHANQVQINPVVVKSCIVPVRVLRPAPLPPAALALEWLPSDV